MSATRTRRRGRAGAARLGSASHACAPRNRRASVRHAENADGCDALSDEAVAKCRDRDALHVLVYNLTRVMNIVGIKPLLAAIGLEERVKSYAPCDRSGRSAWPEVAPGLTPDSIQKNRLRRSCRGPSRPVDCSFGDEKRFHTAWTQSGPRYAEVR
jgi:hypothetical protein